MQPYEILHGVGQVWIAPFGTVFPVLTAVPGGNWVLLSYTVDGVTITRGQAVQEEMVDQEIGPIKAWRSEVTMQVETQTNILTLENMAYTADNAVVAVPAAAGVIGTKELALYCGPHITEYAFLFKGSRMSTYGESFPAQYELPRGYFMGDLAMQHRRDGAVRIPLQFKALINPGSTTNTEKYGRLVMQTATAL
jgi:hypothetical protein